MSYIPLNPPSKGDYKEVWTVELSYYLRKNHAVKVITLSYLFLI